MKCAIFDDNVLTVLNVVKGATLEDVERSVKFGYYPGVNTISAIDAKDLPGGIAITQAPNWAGRGVRYEINDGEREEILAVVSPEETAAELKAGKRKLYDACYTYEESNVDRNFDALLREIKIEIRSSRIAGNKFPKAVDMGAWKKSLWGQPSDTPDPNGSYYARKVLLQSGTEPSFDFGKDYDPCPWKYQDVAYEAIQAGMDL